MQTGWKYVFKRLAVLIVLFVLALIFFAAGLMVGYGVIGDGADMGAILSPDKWQELIRKFTG